MKLSANENKRLHVQAANKEFARYPIRTHIIQVGENYMDLISQYVLPHYQNGDILSISEKIISLCQE